jgi:hypothetical protein
MLNLYTYISVWLITSAKGMNKVKMSHISIIFMYDVVGNLRTVEIKHNYSFQKEQVCSLKLSAGLKIL